MSIKLTQKHLFRGSTEYEITEEEVFIRTKSHFKQETLSVMLAVLNPEPVITKTHLEFVSRVNGEALVSLALSKPDVSSFNSFVNTLKQKAVKEYSAYSGINIAARSESTGNNPGEEPPEFKDISADETVRGKSIDVDTLQDVITMLKTYIDSDDIKPLLSALEYLKEAPKDHDRLVEVAMAFNELGPSQGAVLTYAPYISIILSDDPFGR